MDVLSRDPAKASRDDAASEEKGESHRDGVPIIWHGRAFLIGMAGSSPAMTHLNRTGSDAIWPPQANGQDEPGHCATQRVDPCLRAAGQILTVDRQGARIVSAVLSCRRRSMNWLTLGSKMLDVVRSGESSCMHRSSAYQLLQAATREFLNAILLSR
jgi:hypothetical protein